MFWLSGSKIRYVTFVHNPLAKTNHIVPPNHEGARKHNPTMGSEKEGSNNYLQKKNTKDYHTKFYFSIISISICQTVFVCVCIYMWQEDVLYIHMTHHSPHPYFSFSTFSSSFSACLFDNLVFQQILLLCSNNFGNNTN